jgi:hypothetical protein
LHHAGLSGGTLCPTANFCQRLALFAGANYVGRLVLLDEVLGVVPGLAKAGLTMIIMTHEQVPLGRSLDHPVDERTRRFLRRVAHEEDIAA